MSITEYDRTAADPHYLDSAGRHWGISAMLKVNIVTCSLRSAGSLVMIVPFILFKQLRKVRHRLILGMAVLIPSAWSTYNGAIPPNSPGCNADSFFYLTFVVAGCFWTLTIAITTYITLVQPMSKIANYMHRSSSMYFIWITIWLVCLLNAAIGTALNTSVDGGGFCFFPSVAPYLYGNLVLFVPRAGTFMIIILIYVRLYIFFRHQASSHHKQESAMHEASFHLPLPTPASEMNLPDFQEGPRPSFGGRTSHESTPRQVSNLVTTSSRQPDDHSTDLLRRKLSEYQFAKGAKRKDSDGSDTLVPTRRLSSWVCKGRRKKSNPDTSDSIEARSSEDVGSVIMTEREENVNRISGVLQDSAEILNSPNGFEEQLVLLKPDEGPLGQLDAKTSTRLITPRSQDTLVPVSPLSSTPYAEKGTGGLAASSVPPVVSPLRGIVSMENGISPGSESLLTLASRRRESGFPGLIPPSKDAKAESPVMGLWEALASVDPVDSDDAGLAEACAEKGRRLSASEENRRVSYLMLLYPLAYGIILAVSIARLAVTLATKASPSPWLQILNRVCVLGTGVVDACIYTIIEWRFRASSHAAARRQGEKEAIRLQ